MSDTIRPLSSEIPKTLLDHPENEQRSASTEASVISSIFSSKLDPAEAKEKAEQFGQLIQKQAGTAKTWNELFSDWEKENPQASDEMYEGFLKDFSALMKIKLKTSKDPSQSLEGDWSILNSTELPIDLENPLAENNPLIKAFNHFLKLYKPPKDALNASETAKHFVSQFHSFLNSSETSLLQLNEENIPSYEGLYQSIKKESSKEEFIQKINEFYDAQVETEGYFLPSHAMTDWKNTLQAEESNLSTIAPASKKTTSEVKSLKAEETEGEGEEEKLVINVYAIMQTLLTLLMADEKLVLAYTTIAEIENSAALKYTQALDQLEFLKAGDVGKPGKESDEWKAVREEYNSNVINTERMKMQSKRGIHEDRHQKQQNYTNIGSQSVTDTLNQIDAYNDLLVRIKTSIFNS